MRNLVLSAGGILCILLLFTSSPVAMSACLEGVLSVSREYEKSHAVFVGQVLSKRTIPESKNYLDGETYLVKVDEIFRGRLPETISLFSENSSGRFPMQVGRKYLLFTYKALGRSMVDSCGNSGLMSEKASTIEAIRELARKRAD